MERSSTFNDPPLFLVADVVENNKEGQRRGCRLGDWGHFFGQRNECRGIGGFGSARVVPFQNISRKMSNCQNGNS